MATVINRGGKPRLTIIGAIRASLLTATLTLTLLVSGCGADVEVPANAISRQEYLRGIAEVGLLNATLVDRWMSSADKALSAPEREASAIDGSLPRAGSWTIDSDAPEARAFLFAPENRVRLLVTATVEGEGFLFLDLYRVREEEDELLFSTNGGRGTATLRRGEEYLLRLQPEIYAEGTVQYEVRRSEN